MKNHLICNRCGRSAVAVASMMTLATLAAEALPEFERYRVILERAPFGQLPSAADAAAGAAADSFAKGLRISTIWAWEDGTVYVGIVRENNTSFTLHTGGGPNDEGVELVTADPDAGEAQLRKGGETALVRQDKALPAGPAAAGPARPAAPGGARPGATSYLDRRRQRLEERAATPAPAPAEAPAQPKFTGAALEKHLQEYQMEVIRQGLPPLPIPLTPEMDTQLVKEGVLPP